MICARFVAAFAPNAQEERMQIELTDGTHRFVWRGKHILSQGWKAYTSQGEKTQSDESEEAKEELLAELPNVQEGENLPLDHGTITQHKNQAKALVYRSHVALCDGKRRSRDSRHRHSQSHQ